MPIDAPQYPVNLIVEGQPCLVIGGGPIAARKVAGLVACGAEVQVVAPEPGSEVLGSGATVERRPYRRGDAACYRLVVAATDDPVVNHQVFQDAVAAGIWVNTVDDPSACTFTLPSVLRRGSVLVTVATGGHSPALAAWLRSRIEAELGPEYEVLLDLLSAARDGLKASGRSTEEVDWQSVLDSDMLDIIRAGHIQQARERLAACLSLSSD